MQLPDAGYRVGRLAGVPRLLIAEPFGTAVLRCLCSWPLEPRISLSFSAPPLVQQAYISGGLLSRYPHAPYRLRSLGCSPAGSPPSAGSTARPKTARPAARSTCASTGSPSPSAPRTSPRSAARFEPRATPPAPSRPQQPSVALPFRWHSRQGESAIAQCPRMRSSLDRIGRQQSAKSSRSSRVSQHSA